MPISDRNKCIFIHIPKNGGTSIQVSFKMSDVTHHEYSYYQKKYSDKWEIYKKFAIIRNTWDRVVSNYEYARLESSYWHDTPNFNPSVNQNKPEIINPFRKNTSLFEMIKQRMINVDNIQKKTVNNNPFNTNNHIVPPIVTRGRKPLHPDYNLLKDKTFDECIDILINNKTLLKHPGWDLQKKWIYDKEKLMVDELIDFKEMDKKIFDLFGIQLKIVNQSRNNDYKTYYNKDTIEKIYNFYKVDIDTFGFNFN